MGLGEYPVEFNRKLHGPYDPSRYYGKPDAPLSQVKLGELGQWLGRRSKNPRAMAGAISRAFFRWNYKYCLPRKSGIAPYIQLSMLSMAFFYAINYGKITHHRNVKHHW